MRLHPVTTSADATTTITLLFMIFQLFEVSVDAGTEECEIILDGVIGIESP